MLLWNAFSTSLRVVLTSPGLVLPNQGVVRTSRRLMKRTSRSVRLGRRSGFIGLKKPQSVLKMLFSRAYIYGLLHELHLRPQSNALFARAYIRFLFPEKSIHPFTQYSFSIDFQWFRVWRVGFQSIHTDGECLWKVEKASLHTVKPMKIR